MIQRTIRAAFVCCWFATCAAQTPQIYTAADYAQAEKFLDYNVKPLVYHSVDHPQWLTDGRFWYRDFGPDGVSYMLVDPAKRTKVPAFDHAAVANALNAMAGSDKSPAFEASNLAIDHLSLEDGGTVIRLTMGSRVVRCELRATVKCTNADVLPDTFDVSPDGRTAAFIRANNLWVRDVASGRETQLTKDGVTDFGYATDNAGWTHSDRPILVWSPDSKKIATFQQDQRKVGKMYLVNTTVGHPKLESWAYPLVGDDSVTMIERVAIDVEKHKVVRLKMPPDQHRSTLCDDVSCAGGHGWDDVQWSADSSRLVFVSTSRDHKQEWVRVADAPSGKVRDVMTETAATYFESADGLGIGKDTVNWRYLSQSNEVLWFSERDNWGQLYLYDGSTGALKNQITRGDGDVTQVLHVDEKARVIYFMALGKEADRDPYFAALYRVNFDGTGMNLLTPDNAQHEVTMFPDGRYFVDVASTPETPATAIVRDDKGNAVTEVAHQDISKLRATGWKPPTAITVKARDGKTDLYGFLFKPTDFDASKRYPVIDHVYPGPQTGSCGTRRFVAAHGDDEALAELGFIVVCIDGMGTPGRSKRFHDALYGDLADNTIPDQVAGIKELTAKYPWIDGDRVGIYGHSGGGAATAAAMFHAPDFFKVGVSESGNHDNRLYEDDWAEKWIGLLKKNADGSTNFDSQANENSAKNLKGRLFLIDGTMDDNVPPANTLVMVDALRKANKDFDLLMIPNAKHGYKEATPYVTRRRWDYFVRNLAGGVAPAEYRMKPYAEQRQALDRAGAQ
ncbi:MAG: DPP IV N-terminal domain-containing protein [Acidobacteriota bacterium]|nr:DPP IV N-terminal domain-containing protein [Acidobacteriota bacterium]